MASKSRSHSEANATSPTDRSPAKDKPETEMKKVDRPKKLNATNDAPPEVSQPQVESALATTAENKSFKREAGQNILNDQKCGNSSTSIEDTSKLTGDGSDEQRSPSTDVQSTPKSKTKPNEKAATIKEDSSEENNDQAIESAEVVITIDSTAEGNENVQSLPKLQTKTKENKQSDQRTTNKPPTSANTSATLEKVKHASYLPKKKNAKHELDKVSTDGFAENELKSAQNSVMIPGSAMATKEASAEFRSIGKNDDKQEKVVDEVLRRKCYMWYARMGQPTRDNMKRRVAKMHASCDITPDDVDELPWICSGSMVSASALSKLIIADVPK